MDKRSSMFLRYPTCIDHAYIDDHGRVIGGSYHPVLVVSGRVDETEQVVVDFSAVKKQIKACIDDNESGFDHKLWLIPGYSQYSSYEEDGRIKIFTQACELEMPLNAVKIFSTEYNGSVVETAERAIQSQLWGYLDHLHPSADIGVECDLTENAFSIGDYVFKFRYVHGLKSSTSWGCQNHSHGHLSWVEIEHDAFFSETCEDCRRGINDVKKLTELMDNAVFIFQQNIIAETDAHVEIGYYTERGWWRASYDKSLNKIIVMDEETTVENITDWVVAKLNVVMLEGHVKRLYVSEGLSKGAMKEFSM